MASRSSGNYSREFYKGSVRGREIANDIGWEMFPEKLERTAIIEDPDMVRDDQRGTLRDFGPETNTLFADEAPRRNTFSRGILNLRTYGAMTPTDPYISAGSGDAEGPGGDIFDIQFHDHDPRGFLTEQPWQEYRRLQEANLRRIDFKDDGDYSVPSDGISPYEIYQRIRSAQDWVKARLKIFDTSYEGRSNGGVGIYPEVSRVYKSESEDTSVVDDGSLSATFEDPVNRQRTTMKLSNLVHGGSAFLRTNDTTDHKVAVSAYGKLYSQRGLIPHESQLRILEDDTPWSNIEGRKTAPKKLVKLMASALEDQGNLDPTTAAQSARLMYQDAALSGHAQEKFGGAKDLQQNNRGMKITRDILALMGFVEQDVRFLESAQGQNRRQADHALANLHKMAEAVHSLPANVKLEMRNELLLRSSGGGLRPGADLRRLQDQVVVNPKIVQYMDLMVRRTVQPGDPGANRAEVEADPERRLDREAKTLFVYRNRSRMSEDVDGNRRLGDLTTAKFGQRGEDRVASYRGLAQVARRIIENKHAGSIDDQFHGDAADTRVGRNSAHGETDITALMHNAQQEIEQIDHRLITRRTGPKTNKSAIRRNITSDYASLDFMADAENATDRRPPRRSATGHHPVIPLR
jgi:hypothetical protein